MDNYMPRRFVENFEEVPTNHDSDALTIDPDEAEAQPVSSDDLSRRVVVEPEETLDPEPPIEVPEFPNQEIEDAGDFRKAHRETIPGPVTEDDEEAHDIPPSEEDGFDVKRAVTQWFNPEIRQAIYGLSMAITPIAFVAGYITQENWPIIVGVVDGIFGFMMAAIHTNTERSMEDE